MHSGNDATYQSDFKPGSTPTNFMVPMTKTFITQHFGPEAIQVSSGESVVIINQATSKVYKKPINFQEVLSF